MPICPILVEVIHKDLIKMYGGRYLIQVWNKKGNMIFQRSIGYQVRAWAISRHNETFIYLLDKKDEKDGGDYFHMVELKKIDEYISSK